MDRARFLVRGKVQGVWFRAGTRDVALRLGLSGHARNLASGEVEVLAMGDAIALRSLQEWLQVGPPLARVDAVDCLEYEADVVTLQPAAFDVG